MNKGANVLAEEIVKKQFKSQVEFNKYYGFSLGFEFLKSLNEMASRRKCETSHHRRLSLRCSPI